MSTTLLNQQSDICQQSFSAPCQLPRLSRSHIVYEKSTNICRDYNPLTMQGLLQVMDGAAQQKIIKLFKIQKKILIRGAHSAKTNEGNPRSIYPHLHN